MDGYVFKGGKKSDDIGCFSDAVLLDESSLHPGIWDSPEEITEKLTIAEEVELMIQLANGASAPFFFFLLLLYCFKSLNDQALK